VALGAASPPNDSNATTHLGPTTASTPSPRVQVEGQGLPASPGNPGATSKGTPISLPLLMVVAPEGIFPTNASSVSVYPGNAPLQIIGGVVDQVSGPTTFHIAEGVDAYAHVDTTDPNARGAGVVGQSEDVGVVGVGSTDLAALGSGHVAQASITDSLGNPIAGPPTTQVYQFEQARDMNGVMGLSSSTGSWRRSNMLRVDNTAGTGPFQPVRIIETRNGIGGKSGMRSANSSTTWGRSPGQTVSLQMRSASSAPHGDELHRQGLPRGLSHGRQLQPGEQPVDDELQHQLGLGQRLHGWVPNRRQCRTFLLVELRPPSNGMIRRWRFPDLTRPSKRSLPRLT
jgi:hypothetical protein